jgi:predicted phage terminase large subunit-like protein
VTRSEAHTAYAAAFALCETKAEREALFRQLALNDLFFLLYYIMDRKDIDDDWLYDRCNEVQAEPDGYLDLWAREHYKSTIITFAKTIQDILRDPERTFGIFSYNRPNAKKFLRWIKVELEDNERLHELFPDVLYPNPKRQAPKWSEDDGLVVRRKGNPKESTVEAHGLIESLPTGPHFDMRIYDDVVTEDSVSNVDMLKKVAKRWELSLNLGKRGGGERYVGTRYHYNDAYRTIIDRGVVQTRLYPATTNGQVEGPPTFLTSEELVKKRREMGPYIFGCQMLLDPKADEVQGFLEDWIRYWIVKDWYAMNRYIVVDPASEKKKESDYTCMEVIGLGADLNYYTIDMVRDRLNLTERANTLIKLHRKYRPITGVGYEKYGKDADIEHIQFIQEKENYRFEITALGGPMGKLDRIRRLIPIFEQSRWWMPTALPFVDHEKKQHDLVQVFIKDEYLAFPVGIHDDMLDARARILDPDLAAHFPDPFADRPHLESELDRTQDEYQIFS